MHACLRLLLLGLLLSAGHLFAEDALLRIVGLEKTVSLSPADWEKLPRTTLAALEPHAKTEYRYAGVDARTLLLLVDAPLGDKLRGAAHRLGVLVRARDGYTILFALAEFDAAFSSRTLLLADRMNDRPLRENAAPLQLIAPGDTRGARWVRMVTSLEIVSLPASP